MTESNKHIARQMTVAAAMLLCFAVALILTWPAPAFAQESAGTVLKVYYDDTLMAEYDRNALEGIAAKEGGKSYNYSGMNTYPTPSILSNVTGPTAAGILEDAFGKCQAVGVPQNMEALDPNQLIEIRDTGKNNPYKAVFTVKQFRAERYYFPNVKKEMNRKGAAALPESYEGKVPVPAIIALTDPKDPAKAGRFVIGQLAPNEQNQPEWVQGVVKEPDNAAEDEEGRIIIRSEKAGTWNALNKTDAGPKGEVPVGKEITFNREVNEFKANGGGRYWICYTTDGSEPEWGCAIYNCNNFDFGMPYEVINKPVLTKAGPAVIKAKVFGNGKIDSETAVFKLTAVTDEPEPPQQLAKPVISKLKLKKKTITVQWKKVEGASGYRIYRAMKKNGPYKLIKTIKDGKIVSFTNKKLKKKKTYYYKMQAYRTVSGKTICSGFSAVKYKKVK